MAVKTNTSKTISDSTYGVLANKVANTKANMDKLLGKMGCKEPAKVRRIPMVIPEIPGSKDNVLFLGINGAKFYFRRGESVEMPEPLLRTAVDCGVIPAHYLDMIALMEKQGAETAAKKAGKQTAEAKE